MSVRALILAALALACSACSVQPFGNSEETATPAWTGVYGPGGVYADTARSNLAAGDTEAARSNFEQALKVNPFDAVALNNLAVTMVAQGQYFEAQGLLERAARLAPENFEIAANLSRLQEWTRTYTLLQQSQQAPTVAGATEPAQSLALPSSNLPPEPPGLWGRASGKP